MVSTEDRLFPPCACRYSQVVFNRSIIYGLCSIVDVDADTERCRLFASSLLAERG